jgi:putative Holliday junction resolvase
MMNRPGRILGLDVGGRRIGVAISDELGMIASPAGMVLRSDTSAREIRDHATRLGAVRLIVGMPTGMSGREGPQARDVREFMDSVMGEIGLPVEYWDERLTTSIAEKSLIASGSRREKRKQEVDSVAAAVILQGYLDSRQWASKEAKRTMPAGQK